MQPMDQTSTAKVVSVDSKYSMFRFCEKEEITKFGALLKKVKARKKSNYNRDNEKRNLFLCTVSQG